MEIQLQELIEQIKKDGVATAEAEAKAIIEAAKEDAKKIISDAREQADKIMTTAKSEAERTVKSSEDAIRQAGRNLLISFRESVTRELKVITEQNVTDMYSSEKLVELIAGAVETWASNPEAESITVIMNEKDLNALEGLLLAGLKERIQKGVTLKAGDSFDGGFRVAVNNGSAYYDYSSEAVIEMISNYLSPKVTELLKEA